MNAIKYVLLFPPVNRYLLSLVGSAVESVIKKTFIYTARTAYTTIVR
jgi:hypothetical protein